MPLAHHLKGAHFPARKDDLIDLARTNGAWGAMMETLEHLPDEKYSSMAELMRAYGEQSERRLAQMRRTAKRF